VVPWDWFVLDVSYVMILVGGGMTLRARTVSPLTWLAFFTLSVCVGGFLFAATWQANAGFAADSAATTAAMLAATSAC
jgi:hypothetical protein